MSKRAFNLTLSPSPVSTSCRGIIRYHASTTEWALWFIFIMQSNHGRDVLKQLFECMYDIFQECWLPWVFLRLSFHCVAFVEPDNETQKHVELEKG